jgi:hypothetical protein
MMRNVISRNASSAFDARRKDAAQSPDPRTNAEAADGNAARAVREIGRTPDRPELVLVLKRSRLCRPFDRSSVHPNPERFMYKARANSLFSPERIRNTTRPLRTNKNC